MICQAEIYLAIASWTPIDYLLVAGSILLAAGLLVFLFYLTHVTGRSRENSESKQMGGGFEASVPDPTSDNRRTIRAKGLIGAIVAAFILIGLLVWWAYEYAKRSRELEGERQARKTADERSAQMSHRLALAEEENVNRAYALSLFVALEKGKSHDEYAASVLSPPVPAVVRKGDPNAVAESFISLAQNSGRRLPVELNAKDPKEAAKRLARDFQSGPTVLDEQMYEKLKVSWRRP